MKTRTVILILALAAILAGACNTHSEYIRAEGIVTRIELEGGFWGIKTDDGRKFDPLNLPDEFKKDGLRVNVRLKPRDEMAGFHMWGQVVEVLRIEKARER
ncbi:MAG: hypothetical protein GF409_05370 [Candidatus Omnitrophica bacterium]|nr:hypothetical protein [Candidatus Omnitrophota bacterium]